MASRAASVRSRPSAAFRRILVPAFLALLALLVSACVESSPAGPLVSLVPEGAVFVATIDSPARLVNAAADFWKAAGLSKAFGSELIDFLTKTVPGGGDAERYIDGARPMTLAIIPVGPGSKTTRTVVYVPMRGQSDAFLKKLSDESMKLVKQAKGYAVFATGEGELAFPPQKPLDLSRLSRYPAASIKFWADPKALGLISPKDGFKPIETAARDFVSGAPDKAAGPLAALGERGLALLKQLGSADAAIVPEASGLSIRLGASVLAGSEADAILRRSSTGPSALDWAGQLSATALVSSSWSLDPSLIADYSRAFMKPLFSILKMPASTADAIVSLESRWALSAGPRGVSNVDFEINPAAFTDLKTKDALALAAAIKQGFSIRHEFLIEARDEAGLALFIAGLSGDGDMQAVLKAYADVLGLGIEVRNQDRMAGGFAYGDLGLSFKVLDAEKLAALGKDGSEAGKAGMDAVLDALGTKFGMRWATAQGKLAATTGDFNELRGLLARPSSASPLTGDPAFAAFAKTLPGKVVSVGSFSTKRLATIVSKLGPALSGNDAKGMPKFDPGSFSAWYGYLSTGAGDAAGGGNAGAGPSGPQARGPAATALGSWVEGGFFIPSGDAAALIELASPLFGKQGQ